jgi:hypothetical protein
MTVWAISKDARSFDVSINGGSNKRVDVLTPGWDTPRPFPLTVTLNAGNNSIKFYNASGAAAPDLDRIVVAPTGASCSAESDAAFCSRLAKTCGSVTAADNCGTSRTVTNCGTCGSPLTCGGGGTANVCGSAGGGSSGTCTAAYATASCLTYSVGKIVSRNGHNYTCTNGNCMNCASYTTCEPGATGCPWGVVWSDNGTCN